MRIRRLMSRFLLIGCILGVAVPNSFGQGGGERPARGGGGPGGTGGGGGPGGRGGFGGGMMGGGMMGGGGMASLLTIKEVREELKMDEDQNKDYETYSKEAMEEMRSSMAAMFGGGAGGPGGPGGAGGPGGGGRGGRGGAGGGGPGGGGPGGAAGGMDFTKIREAGAAMQEKSEAKLADILNPEQMDRLVGLYIQRDGVRTLNSKTVATRLEVTADQKAKLKEQETSAMEEMRAARTPGSGQEVFEKLRTESEKKSMDILTQVQKDKMESFKGAKFEFPARPAGGRGPAPQ